MLKVMKLRANVLAAIAYKRELHTKCGGRYAGGVKRVPVPDEKVNWSIDWPEYKPLDYTVPRKQVHSSRIDSDYRKCKFNELDGNVDRRSHCGKYSISDDGFPRNPMGRTGLVGKGLLRRWGPNHAAGPIATRWKRDSNGFVIKKDNKPVLEFVAVKRRDCGEWAIPGEFQEKLVKYSWFPNPTVRKVNNATIEETNKEGMVEPGDTVSNTIKKEFGEEAMNSLQATPEEKKKIEEQINELFWHGEKIYSGYVDDPRNTDNAWIETVAVNFHDESGEAFGKVKLCAGDDAEDVAWKELDRSLALYANHTTFTKMVVDLRKAAF